MLSPFSASSLEASAPLGCSEIRGHVPFAIFTTSKTSRSGYLLQNQCRTMQEIVQTRIFTVFCCMSSCIIAIHVQMYFYSNDQPSLSIFKGNHCHRKEKDYDIKSISAPVSSGAPMQLGDMGYYGTNCMNRKFSATDFVCHCFIRWNSRLADLN